MANGTFAPAGQSPDTFDHGTAALQRWHRERQAAEATQERCERWITAKLSGHSYGSLEELTDAALAVTRAHYARPLTETETTLIVRSCVSLFSGLVDPRYFAGKISIVRGQSITFLRAA